MSDLFHVLGFRLVAVGHWLAVHPCMLVELLQPSSDVHMYLYTNAYT